MSEPIDFIKKLVKGQTSSICYLQLANLINERGYTLKSEAQGYSRAEILDMLLTSNGREYVCTVQGKTQITVFITFSPTKKNWFKFLIAE